MELATSTATEVQDFILSVLIVLSEIVFRWVPATISALTGQPISLSGDLPDVGSMPQVAVDATYYNASGQPVALPVEGGMAVSDAGAASVDVVPFAGGVLETAWGIFAPLSIFVSLLIAVALVYSLIRYFQIRFAEKQALHEAAKQVVTVTSPSGLMAGPSEAQRRWARIQEQIASDNENDWRLAILEADIMLSEALTTHGFVGESIGEQLKGATRGDLQSLDQAWDAHKVRNHIAHRGTMHDINQREAKRVIAEYEQVFREFKIV